MLCCKKNNVLSKSLAEMEEEEESRFTEIQERKLTQHDGISQLDVREWNLEMRENNVVMNEYNRKVKERKIKEDYVREDRLRESKEKLMEEKQREIDQERWQLGEQRKSNEREMKKQLEKQKNLVVKGSNSKDFMILEDNQILATREREIEKKERKVTLQLQKLLKNEKQLENKIAIIDMAIQANQFG